VRSSYRANRFVVVAVASGLFHVARALVDAPDERYADALTAPVAGTR
jgi:hypothetical protein